MGLFGRTIDYGIKTTSVIQVHAKRKYGIGKVHGIGMREEQQDCFGISSVEMAHTKKNGLMMVLSDGMGGMQDGAAMSILTVSCCLQKYDECTDVSKIDLRDILRTANEYAVSYLDSQGIKYGGATALIAVIYNDCFKWASVGDSRIYISDKNGLVQLNRDHIYYMKLLERVKKGEISIEEANVDPQRDALTSFIGTRDSLEIECSDRFIPLKRKQAIIMASDGIYRTIGEDFLKKAFEVKLDSYIQTLEQKILYAGKKNQDNYTALVLRKM